MYKFIGGDGREYGPVSIEQLRQWIAEGRANAQSRVQAEGHDTWQPLAALPELADLFGQPTVPPVPPALPPQPTPPPISSKALAAQLCQRDYQVRLGDWFGQAWDLIKADFWVLVGASFVASLITGTGLIGLVLGGPMLGGLYGLILSKRRGQPASFGDAFNGFNAAFVPLMLTYIGASLLSGLGLLLCLLPGIYLLVSWVFALPLVFDKKLELWDALETSRKVVGKHWWAMFGFLLVGVLLALSGLLVCCIGIVLTQAIFRVAIACAYEEIFNNQRPTA